MTRTLRRMMSAQGGGKGPGGPDNNGPDKDFADKGFADKGFGPLRRRNRRGCPGVSPETQGPGPAARPFQPLAPGDGLRPLTEFPAGAEVIIAGINGGPRARCRLLAMGLTPGTLVRIGSSACGACCVRVRGADVVLGRGLSEKVLAAPAGNGK